jgi:hypothetical protein
MDQPNTGDFQVLISGGETFCHEDCPADSVFEFTLFWSYEQRWEGKDWRMKNL